MISSIEQKTDSSARKQQLAREYRERVEKELREICYEVLVSDNLLIINDDICPISLIWIKAKKPLACRAVVTLNFPFDELDVGLDAVGRGIVFSSDWFQLK